jgi:hypothetical protein
VARTTQEEERLELKPSGMLETPDGFAAGFAVTVRTEVGRVIFGEGERPPHEVAFELIAQSGSDGTFEFPSPDGGKCRVTVEFEGV